MVIFLTILLSNTYLISYEHFFLLFHFNINENLIFRRFDMMFLSCSSDSEKSERKAKKEDKKKKVMPGPVHFGSNEPVILAELDPQVCYIMFISNS